MQYEEDQKCELLAKMICYFGCRIAIAVVIILLLVFAF
jgi:hypothetical protein